MERIEQFITKNDCYQNNLSRADSRYATFQDRGPLGLMLHSVGTPQPNAKVFTDGWNQSGKDVAVHAVLQADGTVYQCMPWNFRGWHAGGAANDTHVGVEMTEPAQIRYTSGASFTVSDLAAATAQAEGCYRTAVDLFAQLCRDYALDPMTAILSHAEGAAQGIASGHADPEHLWRGLGLSYTMDTFRQDVQTKLSSTQPLYRIRLQWQDAKGQLGAYYSLERAIAACPPGYRVFDEKGNEVYRHTTPEDSDTMTRAQILAALGDQYIETYADLPEWAKPEMREILDLGLINGITDEPDGIHMLLSDLRIAIVAYRAFRRLEDRQASE